MEERFILKVIVVLGSGFLSSLMSVKIRIWAINLVAQWVMLG